MTDDTNHELTITGNASVNVAAVVTTDWSEVSDNGVNGNGDGTRTYEYSKGGDSITLTIDDQIDSTGM
jgi:hypothetical protein